GTHPRPRPRSKHSSPSHPPDSAGPHARAPVHSPRSRNPTMSESDMKADLKKMKGISAQDAKMLADAEVLLGPDPSEIGFIKNLFMGTVREDLVFPYPMPDAEETARCDQLIAALDEYLRNDHPAIRIDQDQE